MSMPKPNRNPRHYIDATIRDEHYSAGKVRGKEGEFVVELSPYDRELLRQCDELIARQGQVMINPDWRKTVRLAGKCHRCDRARPTAVGYGYVLCATCFESVRREQC